jgi:hypothetical protein
VTWTEWVVRELTPAFGGFANFVLDPDELLEDPIVRDGLAASGVQVHHWNGTRQDLIRWAHVQESERPLVVISAIQPIHMITEVVTGAVQIDISVSKVFRKIHPDIVSAVPRVHWNKIFQLQNAERPFRSPQESAIAVSRAVYGIDPLYAYCNGWDDALSSIAASNEPLPYEVASIIAPKDNPDLVTALSDLAVARKVSRKTRSKAKQKQQDVNLSVDRVLAASERLIIDQLADGNLPAATLLKMALSYGRLCAHGLSVVDRERANAGFLVWMQKNYDLALTSLNPDVLTLHKLVSSYVMPRERVMLVIIDGMGVEAWATIQEVFEGTRGLRVISEKAAFSVVPTITAWARRSIFEQVLPPQFTYHEHCQALERQLWENSVKGGLYCSTQERTRISDGLYQGKAIAVVDVSWDERGHNIDVVTESISEVAEVWATRCPIADVIREAIDLGYRVIVTSDHGQTVGRGIGLPNMGRAIEARSKRCLLFSDVSSLNVVRNLGIADFKPMSVGSKSNILYATYGASFHNGDSEQVSHGGLSLEEVIVPVVEFGN